MAEGQNPDEVAAMAGLVAGAMANMRDVMEPVLEATRGYRQNLMDMEFHSDLVAEMTGEYHKVLMTMLLNGIQQGLNK